MIVLPLFTWNLLPGLHTWKTWNGLMSQRHALLSKRHLCLSFVPPCKGKEYVPCCVLPFSRCFQCNRLSRAQLRTCLKKRIRPECPWAWARRASAFPPTHRTGSCVPRHVSLEWEGDSVKLYFSLCYVSEVHLDPQRTWCPAADCQTVCHIAPSESGAPVPVECPACHLAFCSSCKEAWHPQRLCQETQTTPVPTEQG